MFSQAFGGAYHPQEQAATAYGQEWSLLERRTSVNNRPPQKSPGCNTRSAYGPQDNDPPKNLKLETLSFSSERQDALIEESTVAGDGSYEGPQTFKFLLFLSNLRRRELLLTATDPPSQPHVDDDSWACRWRCADNVGGPLSRYQENKDTCKEEVDLSDNAICRSVIHCL